MTDSTQMAVTASKYVTQVSVILGDGTQPQLVVMANPRRWRLKITDGTGQATMADVVPGPIPNGFAFAPSIPSGEISEYLKSPSECTGEWYGNGQALLNWRVIETIYKGED